MDNSIGKTIENLKDEIMKMCEDKCFSIENENKPITFRTNDYQIETVTRLPNEKEKIEFIQEALRRLYFHYQKINRNQYKTARRQCINDRESVLRFISKFEREENIFKEFYDYCNSEHEYLLLIGKITFANNIARTIVDIDLNK